MQILIAVVGVLLMAFGLFIISGNYARLIANLRRRGQAGEWSSPAPFVGPLCLAVGFSMLPLRFTEWTFVAFVIDPDTVMTIVSVPWLIRMLLR